MISTRVLLCGALLERASAFIPIKANPFALSYDYSGENFFNNFEFFTDTDPTKGHVKYVDFEAANSAGLVGLLPGQKLTDDTPPPVFLGVDASTLSATTGRNSVRVTSIQTFNHALILADILHMPAPICGTWPAYWILGSAAEWPEAGEIDILENVNDAETNHYTLHTSAGVIVQNHTETTAQKGKLATANCDVNAPNQDQNVGCSVTDAPDIPSYGTAFNDNGGGVFATLVDSAGVQIWFFPRDSIPADIEANAPLPPARAMNMPGADSTWGRPNARFDGPQAQDFDSHFRDMQLIFNIAFCGDWAGSVWNTTESCMALAPTCEEYVSNHPEAFADVYWAIQSVKVFEPANTNWTVPYPDGPGGPSEGKGTKRGEDGWFEAAQGNWKGKHGITQHKRAEHVKVA